jgi:hypothetical protein
MKLYLLALSCLLGACHKGCSPFYEPEDVLREKGYTTATSKFCDKAHSRFTEVFDVVDNKTEKWMRVVVCCGNNDDNCTVKELGYSMPYPVDTPK